METAIQSLLDQATELAGLSDFGDDWFLGPLRAWVVDLDADHLNDFGRSFLANLAVRDLVRRLRVIDTLRAHPEILEVEIPPIVYITGLERSGTTLLHNLLALHEDARALLRWELMEPVPPPEAASHARDPRIARVQASADKLRGSMLERMHWVDAVDPEECVWGFIDSVGMLGQAASFCMPAWRELLWNEDLSPAYHSYRRVIQLLLWKNPVPAGGFLVLKAPQISSSISRFAAVFPEASFLVTDRDSYRVLSSLLTMVESIVDPFCGSNPVSDDGRRDRVGIDRVRRGLQSLMEFSDREPGRVRHLGYPELVREPVASVVGALRDLGIRRDPGLVPRIEGFLAEQKKGRRAAPPAALPTMGYDQDEVLADPVVAAYCDRFGMAPERSRLTG